MVKHVLKNIEKSYKPGQMIITIMETGEVIDLTQHKIYLSTKPNIPNGARNIKVIQTTGRTGFLPLDLKTTQPIEFPIELSAIHRTHLSRENTRNLFERIEGRMVRLEFYSERYCHYEGFITGVEISNTNRLSTHIKAVVHAQSYRLFNHSTNRKIRLSNGDSFSIDKGYIKLKLFLTGSGDITITHNGVDMKLQAVPGNTEIIIDCVNKYVYRQHSANHRTHYGHLKVNKPYIEIVPDQAITWTGNVTKMECEFDWRSVN